MLKFGWFTSLASWTTSEGLLKRNPGSNSQTTLTWNFSARLEQVTVRAGQFPILDAQTPTYTMTP
jgi:hypothetical protein